MKLLAVFLSLTFLGTSVCADEGCRGFKNLENGQTFFRYGGLLVVFRCRPGYRLHGYNTNSCVLGHWSRDLPVCVASGCSSPGSPIHGTSSVMEHGSWVQFSCHPGFRLYGPSMLYCKGKMWNSTRPVCKEADMMQHQNKAQHLLHHSPDSKASKSESSNLGPLRLSTREKIRTSDRHATQLQKNIHSPVFKDQVQTVQIPNEQERLSEGTTGKVEKLYQGGEAKHPDRITQPFAFHFPSTVSSTVSLLSATQQSTSSPLSFPTAQTPAVTGSSNAALQESSLFNFLFSPPALGSSEPTPLITGTTAVFFEKPTTKSLLHTSYTPLNSLSSAASPSKNSSQNQKLNPTKTPSHPTTNSKFFLSWSHRPACPYPPVPAHGTFSFHSTDKPGPREHQHHIQYACYPGYTLAHGDIRSYCQPGGSWSGRTPVCQDVDECLLPPAVTGCMFGCVNTAGSFYCWCPLGYSFQTAAAYGCQDIDECAVNQGHGWCSEQCHNSPGSFRCSCSFGHILAGDGRSCIAACPSGYRKQPSNGSNDSTAPKEECVDTDECQEKLCEGQCINLPGSYRCICARGYSLQSDGRRCRDINECDRKNGGCSHLCLNQRGGYKCACPASHRLSPYSWKKCLRTNDDHTVQTLESLGRAGEALEQWSDSTISTRSW